MSAEAEAYRRSKKDSFVMKKRGKENRFVVIELFYINLHIGHLEHSNQILKISKNSINKTENPSNFKTTRTGNKTECLHCEVNKS